jgi:serpin B
MKRFGLYAIIASMICLIFACNNDDSNSIEDIQNLDPVELENDPSPEPEPVEYKPFVPIELTTKQGEKVSADNHFTFKMFKELSATIDEPNTFFSPLSLHLALGMLYSGASGETRTEMAEVLGMADFTEAEINEFYQKLTNALLESDPFTTIGIANSIWYREHFPGKQSFIDINQKYFDKNRV